MCCDREATRGVRLLLAGPESASLEKKQAEHSDADVGGEREEELHRDIL